MVLGDGQHDTSSSWKRPTYETTPSTPGDTTTVDRLGRTRHWTFPIVHRRLWPSTRKRESGGNFEGSFTDLARRQFKVYLYCPDILEYRHREAPDRLTDGIIYLPRLHARIGRAVRLVSSNSQRILFNLLGGLNQTEINAWMSENVLLDQISDLLCIHEARRSAIKFADLPDQVTLNEVRFKSAQAPGDPLTYSLIIHARNV